jgi:hypothetical protein
MSFKKGNIIGKNTRFKNGHKSVGGFKKGNQYGKTNRRWSKGLTKETSPIILRMANKKKGKHFSIKTEFKKGIIPKTCFKKGNKGKLCPAWKGGLSFEPYTTDWTKTLKHSIRERDHFVCQICYKNGWYVHHINYDKKNCNPDNLITLCHSCHTKTNHNRNYWINYFKQKL